MADRQIDRQIDEKAKRQTDRQIDVAHCYFLPGKLDIKLDT